MDTFIKVSVALIAAIGMLWLATRNQSAQQVETQDKPSATVYQPKFENNNDAPKVQNKSLGEQLLADKASWKIKKSGGPYGELVHRAVDPTTKTKLIIKEYTEYIDKKSINHKIANYFKASKLGIGVNILMRIRDNYIVMKEHTLLIDAINQHKITKKEALSQLDQLSYQMKKLGLQHCDVKPSNLVFDDETKKVLFIDNGEIIEYGEVREVFTPQGKSKNIDSDTFNFCKQNKTTLKVDHKTDDRGYYTTKERINQL